MTDENDIPPIVRGAVRVVDVVFAAMAALTIGAIGLLLLSAVILEILSPTLNGLALVAVVGGLLYAAIKMWPYFTKATKL
jgi:hypothetical protein